jgi:hypothetical protein
LCDIYAIRNKRAFYQEISNENKLKKETKKQEQAKSSQMKKIYNSEKIKTKLPEVSANIIITKLIN